MLYRIRGRRGGFTLVEIMIVILILGLLLGIAVPSMLTARTKSSASSCRENLRSISSAKERWAMENNQPATATPSWADIVPIYLKGTQPQCPVGGTYTIGALNQNPTCSHGGTHALP